MIQITCKGNSAICTRTERLTSGMVGLQCKFEFDGAWDGLAKMAVFTAGNEKRDVLLTGAICDVPPEVMRKPGYQLVIGVYGTNADGTLVIPTCYAMCGGIGPGADPSGDESTDPTLPVWGQMQGMIGNLADLKTDSKDNLVAAINEAAQSGGSGGASIELDTTLTQSGKAADAKAVGDALAEKQPKGDYLTQNELPDMTAYRTAEAQDVIDAGKQATLIQSGATVGQIAKITAVDSNGKPTAWQAVYMPSGGGGGHWETVLDTVWEQDVIHPTAFDTATGIFTCAEGELNNLALNTEYAFYSQCTKEGIAYNTILSTENVKVTKLSETTFSIDVTPPTTFVPANVKFSRGACLAITDIDAKKIRLTLDGQFTATATLYNTPFYGVNVPYFGRNTGYQQIRNAYHAYQQVTAEVESPYRIVGEILCGFNAPSSTASFHFKNNSFCCPLVPYDVPEGNAYILNSDGTKIAKLYSTQNPWHLGGGNENIAILNDRLRIISGTKVKLERWVE